MMKYHTLLFISFLCHSCGYTTALRGAADREVRNLAGYQPLVPTLQEHINQAKIFFSRQDHTSFGVYPKGNGRYAISAGGGNYGLLSFGVNSKVIQMAYWVDSTSLQFFFTDAKGTPLPTPKCQIGDYPVVSCEFCPPTHGALLAYKDPKTQQCHNVMDPRAVGYEKLTTDMKAATIQNDGTCTGPVGPGPDKNMTVTCSTATTRLVVAAHENGLGLVHSKFVQVSTPSLDIQVQMNFDAIPTSCSVTTTTSSQAVQCSICDPGTADIRISTPNINGGACTSVWNLINIK